MLVLQILKRGDAYGFMMPFLNASGRKMCRCPLICYYLCFLREALLLPETSPLPLTPTNLWLEVEHAFLQQMYIECLLPPDRQREYCNEQVTHSP